MLQNIKEADGMDRAELLALKRCFGPPEWAQCTPDPQKEEAEDSESEKRHYRKILASVGL